MYANRTKIMMISAMMLAIFASWLAYSWVQKRAGEAIAENEKATSEVVAAAVEVSHGMKIEAAHLKMVKWPSDLLPEGAYTKLDDVVGKVASRTIFPEDLLTDKRVADHLGGSHLAALISKNKRAVTIRVDDVIGVAGFLLPGNRVDVIGVRQIPNSHRVEAQEVMKDVVVLAVDQEISAEKNQPKVVRAVTLEMLPSSALKVVKAANEGKIQLVLRNPVEEMEKPLVKVAISSKPKSKPVKKLEEKPKALNVTVIRGTQVNNIKPNS